MPVVKVLNQEGSIVKDLELNNDIFGVEANMQVVYDVVNAERAAKRQGTHDTKGRSEVSGGGKKPWRQKGTGRARQGTIRAPQWRGGGIVFGPTPRSYAVKCNKKAVKLAKKCLLSNRLALNKLVVVEDIQLETFKTKDFVKVLENLKVEGKALVVLAEENDEFVRSARNVPGVKVVLANNVSVYDLLNANKLVCTVDAVKAIEGGLK